MHTHTHTHTHTHASILIRCRAVPVQQSCNVFVVCVMMVWLQVLEVNGGSFM